MLHVMSITTIDPLPSVFIIIAKKIKMLLSGS